LIFVPNGPFRKPAQRLKISACFDIFRMSSFRSAAFGYFGHMWELYAFWAFVPILIQTYNNEHSDLILNTSFWSFLIIGLGGLACIFSGYLAQIKGAKKVAKLALTVSGFCCLISPLLFLTEYKFLFIGFLVLWGMAVIADSPLFSTLVAQNVAPEIKGTALTIVNCIGFAITIVSIQLLSLIQITFDPKFSYLVLAIGPIIGLLALSHERSSMS